MEKASRPGRSSAPAPARDSAPTRSAAGLARLQRDAGNQAVGALLGAEPRAIQRDDDDLWGDIKSFGSEVASVEKTIDQGEAAIGKGAMEGVDYLNTPFRNAAKGIDQDVGLLSQGIDIAENFEHDVVHGAADAVKDVPVLGTVAQTTAGVIDTNTQLAGGLADGALGLGGGLLKGVVDPVDFAKGIGGLVSNGPVAKGLQGAEKAAGDLVSGDTDKAEKDLEQGGEDAFNSVYGGLMTGEKDGKAPANAGLFRKILDPAYNDVARGKSAHGVGRVGAQLGALVFGGEIAEAADGALGADAAGGEVAGAAPEAGVAPEAASAADLESLSPAARDAYEAALKAGKSPAAALQEARGLDQAARDFNLGGKQGPAAEPDIPPPPADIPPRLRGVYEGYVRTGSTPEEAAQLTRELDKQEGLSAAELATPRAGGGGVARPGAKPGGGFTNF